MALTRQQYDSIMLQYANARSAHRLELEKRRHLVYAKIPAYQDLDADVPSLGMQRLRSILSGRNEVTEPALKAEIGEVARKKRQLLRENGFPEDYLDPSYDCPDCHDTGYIGTEKCRCYRRKELAILYDQSHLKVLAKTNNFSLLSEEYYEDSMENLSHFRKAVETCRRFIEEFDTVPRNLYFFGTVGTGKSFLSICVADELLKAGRSVLYFSSAGLFDIIANYKFITANREEYAQVMEDLSTSDLLVIDDLGTEMTNSFVIAQLFAILNGRALNGRATIISTNLPLQEMQERYSDRIFSRITSSFEICKLTGKDIRFQIKMKERNAWNP